jgi:spermidine/putrescine transport system substrate-binding protein
MILMVSVAIFGVAGCSSDKNKLYIYNWTYYVPDEVLRDFEKKFNAKIVYDMYASNEEMFAKLQAGGTGYDLVFPSGDYVSIMIRKGMLEKIDKSRVPNLANIDQGVMQKIHFDEGSQYSVPYMMGAAGISVNKKQLQNYEHSWNVFEKPELKGRCTLLDDMREVLGGALKTLGYSVNSVNPEELQKAKDVVLKWKENIVKFDAEAFGKGFASGEFWCVHGYAENVFLELDSSMIPDVDFFIPREGTAMYMDNMVLLKDAKNKDLAYQFMNYIHEPEVFAKIVDFLKLPSINTAANAHRKVQPKYLLSDLANSEFKDDLGDNLELYNKIWQEIRVGK